MYRLFNDNDPVPEAAVRVMAERLLTGLAALHGAGLAHLECEARQRGAHERRPRVRGSH